MCLRWRRVSRGDAKAHYCTVSMPGVVNINRADFCLWGPHSEVLYCTHRAMYDLDSAVQPSVVTMCAGVTCPSETKTIPEGGEGRGGAELQLQLNTFTSTAYDRENTSYGENIV